MTGGYVSSETKEDMARLMMGRSFTTLKPHEQAAVIGAARKQAGHEAELRGKGEQGVPSPMTTPRPQHMGKIVR